MHALTPTAAPQLICLFPESFKHECCSYILSSPPSPCSPPPKPLKFMTSYKIIIVLYTPPAEFISVAYIYIGLTTGTRDPIWGLIPEENQLSLIRQALIDCSS